jgi:hypothetical protein
MARTAFHSLFLITFLLSAAVQFNDPDALPWVAIYLTAATLCVAQLRRRLPRWPPLFLLIICLIWIFSLLPNIVGQVSLPEVIESISMKTKAVEEAREIGGLALVALWAAVTAYYLRG